MCNCSWLVKASMRLRSAYFDTRRERITIPTPIFEECRWRNDRRSLSGSTDRTVNHTYTRILLVSYGTKLRLGIHPLG